MSVSLCFLIFLQKFDSNFYSVNQLFYTPTMKTKPVTLFTLFVFTCLVNIQFVKAQLPLFPDLPDLILRRPDLGIWKFDVNNVDETSFNIEYTILNKGDASLPLVNFYYEVYLSIDATFDASDVMVKRVDFSNLSPTIQPQDIYVNGKKITTTLSLDVYRNVFIIFKVKENVFQFERNKDNNSRMLDMRPYLPELFINHSDITGIEGNTIRYSFETANMGKSTLHLDRFQYKIYLSEDERYNPGTDVWIYTGLYGTSGTTLGEDDFKKVMLTLTSPINISAYDYVIVKAELLPNKKQIQRAYDNDYNPHSLFVFTHPDITVTSLTVKSISNQVITFDYSLKNRGNRGFYTHDYLVDVYLSADNTLGGNDVLLSSLTLPEVLPNTFIPPGLDTTYKNNKIETGLNLSQYNYLFVKVKIKSVYPVEEVVLTNNVLGDNIEHFFIRMVK